MAAQDGTIGNAVEQVEQLAVSLHMVAPEFCQPLVDAHFDVDGNSERLECFDTAPVWTRHHHTG